MAGLLFLLILSIFSIVRPLCEEYILVRGKNPHWYQCWGDIWSPSYRKGQTQDYCAGVFPTLNNGWAFLFLQYVLEKWLKKFEESSNRIPGVIIMIGIIQGKVVPNSWVDIFNNANNTNLINNSAVLSFSLQYMTLLFLVMNDMGKDECYEIFV